MASVTGYDSGAISISDGIHTIYLSADDIAEINRIVAERQKKIEDAERAEYERLKKKFDPVVAMPEPTPTRWPISSKELDEWQRRNRQQSGTLTVQTAPPVRVDEKPTGPIAAAEFDLLISSCSAEAVQEAMRRGAP